MTRVFGHLFSDERSGILAVQPSKPFFGCGRHERHFKVIDGSIDLILDPTPAGVYYMVGYKQDGDTRRTDFTLNWRIPDIAQFDVTPGATNETNAAKDNIAPTSSVYERVQLKRVAEELSNSMSESDDLSNRLMKSELEVERLKAELDSYRSTTDAVLNDRDEMIAQLSEQSAPIVKTVYLDKPVPPEPLRNRITFLEQENKRLADLNAQYYKSVVQLHQLQLDKAQSAPKQSPVELGNSPQSRLLRKLLGK